MEKYILDKELVLSITNILKSLVPLFAALVASYLTYKFSKKDKIRDHLFSYKVKSYSAIAESIIEIKRDFLSLRTSLLLKKDHNGKTATEIWDHFNKTIAQQSLFMSDRTKKNIYELESQMFLVIEKSIFRDLTPSDHSVEQMMQTYEDIGLQCDIFMEKIQRELGIHNL